MVDFLLLIETIQGYTKHEIDRGLTPLNVYTICSCIRESFCLSYSIRKENNLLLFSYEKLHLIKFQGDKLRFLGSDERSQALLLNKALQLVNQQNISERWTKSTPGIFVRKFENMPKFITFITQNYRNHLFILNDYIKGDISLDYIKLNDLKDLNDYLYILPIFQNKSKIYNSIHKFNNIKVIVLPKIEKPEIKILYINFLIDKQLES